MSLTYVSQLTLSLDVLLPSVNTCQLMLPKCLSVPLFCQNWNKLDCNSLLAGCPDKLLTKLELVQNSAARLVYKIKKSEHVTPYLRKLHWLPVKERIQYKVASLTFNCISTSCPSYLSSLLELYVPSRQLRSASDTRKLCVPIVKAPTFGGRSFLSQSPLIWNSLPLSLRNSDSKELFKQNLKTHLFPKSWIRLAKVVPLFLGCCLGILLCIFVSVKFY